jgi:glycosyltransferase involved in cell wall biosynthesis
MRGDKKIVVVTAGLSLAKGKFLSNLVKILHKAFTGSIYVLLSRAPTYNDVYFDERVHVKQVMPENENLKGKIADRIIKDLLIQLLISNVLAKEREAEAYIFFLAQSLMLPILILKISRKNVVLISGASYSELSKSRKDRLLFIPKIEEKISYKLADHIIIYSESLISKWNLEKYRHKILIAHRHFLDFETFTVTTSFPDRLPLIGYIGRLSGEKGVQHFARALPAILGDRQDLRVLIGGEGQLRESIVSFLQQEDIAVRVVLPGWISHDELPDYLNQLRLLILPSYTEGLPNIMLEAMACGTPVLATAVGAVPDVIIDGKTGFIMENNSPECIAENVIRALSTPNLEEIAEVGRRFVEENFTFECVVERWKEVLDEI